LSKIVYKYPPFVTVYKKNINNKFFKKKNFHKILLQNSAMIILVNDKNQILFLNEYRPGIKKKTLGFPGGHIEKGESALKSAKRELLEETGYIAKKWKLLFKYTRHGTYNCGQDFVFIAKVDRIIKGKNIENAQKKWLNIIKIEKLLEKKKFKTVGIISALLYYLYLYKIKKWKI
jgi:ADP-ribose pyrophosphatase